MRCGIIPVVWDDANDNAALRPESVVKARATEMEYFKNMGVYEIAPRSHVDECRGKLIDTRWIDTNKVHELNPEYRSRFVGREFNTGSDDSLFASTPPLLEWLRLIASWAATVKKNGIGRAHELMIQRC